MKKVVLVDDNKEFLGLLKSIVEFGTDMNCITFANPNDALRYILDEKEIYAVVTDFEMPEMNGFRLVKQVLSKLPTTKVIVISVHDTGYLEKVALDYEINKDKVKFLSKLNLVNLLYMLINH